MEKMNFTNRIKEMEPKKKVTPSVYWKDTELAERFNVSRPTVWRWAAKGDFPAPVQLSPGCSRWYGPTVDEWDRQRREA